MSPEEQRLVALSLVDIVFAFAYDSRINDWETCCETGWNVTKLSPTLVFLCQWSSAKEAFVACTRRSLCYPLYRNWEFKLHGIFVCSGEFRYLFNDLFISDYVLWIQSVDEAILNNLQKEVADVTVGSLKYSNRLLVQSVHFIWDFLNENIGD
ncbi:unnamed protein product [Nippostrongylus brasiliensis]|uniref:Protein SHQ1 homolog n=1 Tax=Nippostrongylus brasiliensis TaxID=27835 RepID=A0A3P7BMY3_NIPBR|nr:unnamed protein product [Nippostrongylus brasiliensis]